MHRRNRIAAAALVCGSLLRLAPAAADTTPPGEGDPAHGRQVYQACMACHSLDENDVGPRHRGVLGRPAGTVPDYPYSPALRNSGLTWDAATLDRWLQGPTRLVPGSKMFFSLASAQDRADVIAWLAQQR